MKLCYLLLCGLVSMVPVHDPGVRDPWTTSIILALLSSLYKALRNKDSEMCLSPIFCHHTSGSPGSQGGRKRPWIHSSANSVQFKEATALCPLISTVRVNSLSETSYPLRTHKGRANIDINTKYRETVTLLKCIYRTSLSLLPSLFFPLLIILFLSSLPKMSYSRCLPSRQLRGDPLVIYGDERMPWIK